MSKKAMYELRNMLCAELDEIARKGEPGAGDLDIAHKLTDTIKNIDKIEALGGGYSGHYSRDGAMESMKRQLQEMLDNADDESIRKAIQRCMDTIEG